MTAESDVLADGKNFVIDRSGAAVRVVFDRPEARNAITDQMRAGIAAMIPTVARDPDIYALILRSAVPNVFSAGGDVREIADLVQSNPVEARSLLARKYALHWLLECFSKPTIALIDGLVMGAGVGVSIYATHRVAGENYAFAMPETGIGLFPDDGLARVFARMPDHIGLYLGLTGRRIGRADAFHLGLVTHCIPASEFAVIEAALSDADPVDPLLDDRHVDPDEGEIFARRNLIASCFSASTLEDVIARLETEAKRGGSHGAWCTDVLGELRSKSPTGLKVAFRHIRDASGYDIRQTLVADYRLVCGLLEGHDFREGVRAMLIDKDRNPVWSPASIEAVKEADIAQLFAADSGRELVLQTREEMQAARV
jgi:enoyl-CoA hydratase